MSDESDKDVKYEMAKSLYQTNPAARRPGTGPNQFEPAHGHPMYKFIMSSAKEATAPATRRQPPRGAKARRAPTVAQRVRRSNRVRGKQLSPTGTIKTFYFVQTHTRTGRRTPTCVLL